MSLEYKGRMEAILTLWKQHKGYKNMIYTSNDSHASNEKCVFSVGSMLKRGTSGLVLNLLSQQNSHFISWWEIICVTQI